eukprot:COSAG02_NODE_7516_length_2976_cov_6.158498_1_plen_285_part_00
MVLSDVTNRHAATASPAMAWLRTASTTKTAAASYVAFCSGGAPPPPAVVAQLRLPTRSSSACSGNGSPAPTPSVQSQNDDGGRTSPAIAQSHQKLRDAVTAWSQAVDVSLGSCASVSHSFSSSGSPGRIDSPSPSAAPQSPALHEAWPSPSAFGTPRASSPCPKVSANMTRSPNTTQGSLRVLPRLIQKFEKMRTELATHKADAASLRIKLKEEQERSAVLARAVTDKSSELAQLHLELHDMQTSNSRLRMEVEQARESLADSNRRAHAALLSISRQAELVLEA